MTRTQTCYRWLRALIIVGGLLVFAVLIVFPLLTPWVYQLDLPHRQVAQILSAIQTFQVGLMNAITMLWFFVLGSCLASFLNVVAWRVPRGKPITGSSLCPHCKTRLAFADNLPVIGWLRNDGRCRTCRQPIAIRYLIAEVVLGFIFLALATVAFQTGGGTWPLRAIDKPAGFENLLLFPKWDLILILGWHLALLSFLFTVMLIESEHRRVPVAIWATAAVLGVTVAALAPCVLLVPWQGSIPISPSGSNEWQLPFTLVAGMAVGSMVGLLVDYATQEKFGSTVSMIAVFGAIGLFLGWQAAIFVGALSLLIRLLQMLCWRSSIGQPRAPRTACVMLATFLFLIVWRTLFEAA